MKARMQPSGKAIFKQDGWHSIVEQPIVHKNYNADIAQISGIALLFVAILIIVILMH
jgi:hypothetical protein